MKFRKNFVYPYESVRTFFQSLLRPCPEQEFLHSSVDTIAFLKHVRTHSSHSMQSSWSTTG